MAGQQPKQWLRSVPLNVVAFGCFPCELVHTSEKKSMSQLLAQSCSIRVIASVEGGCADAGIHAGDRGAGCGDREGGDLDTQGRGRAEGLQETLFFDPEADKKLKQLNSLHANAKRIADEQTRTDQERQRQADEMQRETERQAEEMQEALAAPMVEASAAVQAAHVTLFEEIF